MRLPLRRFCLLVPLALAPISLGAQASAWDAPPHIAAVDGTLPLGRLARRPLLTAAVAVASTPAPPPVAVAAAPAGVRRPPAGAVSAARAARWSGAMAPPGRGPTPPARRWYTWGGATLGALTAITLAVYHAEDDPGEDMGSSTAPGVALAGLAGAAGGYFAGAWLYAVLHER